MLRERLKIWMAVNDKTPTDVASMTGYHYNTILRILKSEECARSTRLALERLIGKEDELLQQPASRNKTTA